MAGEEQGREAVFELALRHGWSDGCVADVLQLLDLGRPVAAAGRYALLEVLGRGASGVVHRAWDPVLERHVALKLLAPRYDMAEVLDEARVLARLNHPNIVAIHDVGRLDDGRGFLTMPVVRGGTFRTVLAELRCAQPHERRPLLRRAVEQLRRVAVALDHAHGVGVLHRDLKPENVVVEDGAVRVVDWGLARHRAGGVGGDHAGATREGQVKGTLLYMAPEQARGAWAEVGPHSDVYALGAMLYELLEGEPPFDGTAGEVLAWLRAGTEPRAPVGPHELVAICVRTLAPEHRERTATAAQLASELGAWLEGTLRSERALERVVVADGFSSDARDARGRARVLRDEARQAHDRLGRSPEEAALEAVWALEDEAASLEAQAAVFEGEAEQALWSALTLDDELAVAHARLADRFAAGLRQAELDGRAAELELHLSGLRRHDDGRHAGLLSGSGRVELSGTGPVELFRFVSRGRRLVTEEPVALELPSELSLPAGSYVAAFVGCGRRVPFVVRRGERVALDAGAAPWTLPDDVAYVAGGPFRAGGDGQAFGQPLPPAVVSVAAFVIQRHPVTLEQYLRFVNTLVAGGREAEALGHAPRHRSGAAGQLGSLCFGRDEEGRFELATDADGDRWLPRWPAMMVPWTAATAYARWRHEETGLPWRLPTELEWEKAARGVDGRAYPWGDHFHHGWCNSQKGGRPKIAEVGSFGVDESVYGVLDLAGNVSEWCADVFTPGGDDRVVRGGNWHSAPSRCRAASRGGLPVSARGSLVGFRLVCSWPPEELRGAVGTIAP